MQKKELKQENLEEVSGGQETSDLPHFYEDRCISCGKDVRKGTLYGGLCI